MLIPLGHETRVQHFPYVTVGLMILNLVIFIPSWYGELSYQVKMREVAEKIQAIDPYFDIEKEMTSQEKLEIVENDQENGQEDNTETAPINTPTNIHINEKS
jgi:hypothetical protein